MKNQGHGNSIRKWAHQDLQELLQQGRALHDRAVFEFFSGLLENGLQSSIKLVAKLFHLKGERYQNHRGLSSIR